MLVDLLQELKKMHIILASQSPRRSELLRNLGLVFSCVPSSFAEDLPKAQFTPKGYVIETCRLKGVDVLQTLIAQKKPLPDIAISSDTVVVHNSVILEKPSSPQHAIEMLTALQGSTHEVFSGVCIFYRKPGEAKQGEHNADGVDGYDCYSFAECTEVTFAPLTREIIEAYVATGEPMDKAGGYGIQGMAGSMISQIRGCYFNVMGFPLHKFSLQLRCILKGSDLPAPSASTEKRKRSDG